MNKLKNLLNHHLPEDLVKSMPIRKVFLILLFVELILLILFYFPESWSATIYDRLNLDREANIPTWFLTILLFLISLLSLIIYLLDRNLKSGTAWSSFWLVFSIVYCFLSIDEGARMHEILMDLFNLKWVYVYAPLGAIFFLSCVYFFISVNRNKALSYWILGGLIVYASGGLGCEVIYFFIYRGKTEVLFEEGLEMLGSIIVLTGCLKELIRRHELAYKLNF